jgi:ABC-2 type transport system permease protein
MLQVKGAPFSWGTLLIGYVQHMCFFTLVYMTVVLAVILTGNLIVGLLGTGVFFSWGPGVAAVISTYFSEYFMTFYDNGNFLLRWCERTSPVFWYGTATGSDHPTRMAVIALAVAAWECSCTGNARLRRLEERWHLR